jgi:hypothetical protein
MPILVDRKHFLPVLSTKSGVFVDRNAEAGENAGAGVTD